jgi:hypothetical protein
MLRDIPALQPERRLGKLDEILQRFSLQAQAVPQQVLDSLAGLSSAIAQNTFTQQRCTKSGERR